MFTQIQRKLTFEYLSQHNGDVIFFLQRYMLLRFIILCMRAGISAQYKIFIDSLIKNLKRKEKNERGSPEYAFDILYQGIQWK